MRSIVVGIFQALSLLAFAAGLVELFMAVTGPNNYVLKGASAVQITQVYSELTYAALIAIAFFAAGAFIQFIVYIDGTRRHQQLLERQIDELIEAQVEA